MAVGIRNVLIRRYLLLNQFDDALAFYEDLFGEKARLRFDYEAAGLKLAQVASLLLIGGAAEQLEGFKATQATFLVRDIDASEHSLIASGCQILRPIKDVPTGHNMLVKHPDGMIVEYVQHKDPDPADDVYNT